jgi:hypothetical protein
MVVDPSMLIAEAKAACDRGEMPVSAYLWICNRARALAVPARAVGSVRGPVEMLGYDYIRLRQDHEAVLPDTARVPLPAGTLLFMDKPAEGEGGPWLSYEQGKAATTTPDPRDGGEA